MPKPSRIKGLPPELKEMVHRLLREGSATQSRILELVNAELDKAGEKPLSKSGLNRYAQSVEKIGERIRQSREIADIWVGKLGDVPEGRVGRLLLETVRTLAFETTNTLAGAEAPVPPKVLNDLAKMARNLELAMSTNAQREIEIRERARKETEASMRQKLDTAQAGGALDPHAAAEARRILGFA